MPSPVGMRREDFVEGWINAFKKRGYSVHTNDDFVNDWVEEIKKLGLSKGGNFGKELAKWNKLLLRLPKDLQAIAIRYHKTAPVLFSNWVEALDPQNLKKKKLLAKTVGGFVRWLGNNKTAIKLRRVIDETSELKDEITTGALMGTIKSLMFANIYIMIFILFANAGLDLSSFLSMQDIACVLGPVPIGSWGPGSTCCVDEIEIAHSNKVVKFRAVGSVFLAHQGGAQDSVKITGKLQGENRNVWFLLFWIITALSRGSIEPSEVETLSDPLMLRAKCGDITSLSKIGDKVVEVPKEKQHLTFPLVTRHTIIPNCYVETFSFEEKIEHGKDVIVFDLLLRTYDKVSKTYQYGNKVGSYTSSKLKQPLEYLANVGYRTFKYYQAGIDDKTWKINNYFNVDAEDVATSATIGIIATFV